MLPVRCAVWKPIWPFETPKAITVPLPATTSRGLPRNEVRNGVRVALPSPGATRTSSSEPFEPTSP